MKFDCVRNLTELLKIFATTLYM